MINAEMTTFLGYFILLFFVAMYFFFNGGNRNQEDYFLGGRSMGAVGDSHVGSSFRYVCMAADGSSRFNYGIWFWADVDRHRTCAGNGGQLDVLRQAIEKIFQSRR